MKNITKSAEEYIKNHPFIRQALKNNIINYSKLARMISRERNINNFDAILIACRRYYQKIHKKSEIPSVINLLKGSKLSIRSNIAVVIIEPDASFRNILQLQKEIHDQNEIIHVIRGANAITLIVTEDFLYKIEKRFRNNIIKVNKNLIEIVMKSPVKLESLPGVMGHIYSLFSENDVNIIETLSCWTDTIIVINRDDLSKTMELLTF